MKKYRNKYRNGTCRLQPWDYRNEGSYFITICSKDRLHYFGEVIDGEMNLNEIGKLAKQFWMEIPKHFPFVALGNFIVMPNHTHGVLTIKNRINKENNPSPNPTPKSSNCESTIKSRMSEISPKSGSIGIIVNQYKRIVTINARKIDPDFGWQSRFHDHIIRNSIAFQRIQNYIENNPQKWNEDRFK